MKSESRPVRTRDGFETSAFFLLAAVLLFAPLIKGGNRPLPLLTLELAAVLLLAYPLMRPLFVRRLSGGMLLGLGLLLVLPLLQLLPIPFSMWQSLPGREIYAEALAAFGVSGEAGMRPLSLLPQATEAAWLALLPPLAVFLVAVSLRESALRVLVYLFIAMATLQAILALVQFGGGASTTFRTSLTDIGSGVGTYVNRNHLAGMLAMALPLALGLLASRIGRAQDNLRYRSRGWFRRLADTLSHPSRINQTLIFSAICIAILLGIIFSRSRSGITLAMLGIFLSAIIYGFRIGGRRSSKLVVLFSVIGLALALEVGLAPVLERFSVEGSLEDARWSIFASSLAAIGLVLSVRQRTRHLPRGLPALPARRDRPVRQPRPQRLHRVSVRRRADRSSGDPAVPGRLCPRLAAAAATAALGNPEFHAGRRRHRPAADGAARTHRLQLAHPRQRHLLRADGRGVLPPRRGCAGTQARHSRSRRGIRSPAPARGSRKHQESVRRVKQCPRPVRA
jgi:hypothetical protein